MLTIKTTMTFYYDTTMCYKRYHLKINELKIL